MNTIILEHEVQQYLNDSNRITKFLNLVKENDQLLYDQLQSLQYDDWNDFKIQYQKMNKLLYCR